jgi:MFS family permease
MEEKYNLEANKDKDISNKEALEAHSDDKGVDSKYAWFQAIIGLMVHFALFGTMGSFGVYLAEYLQNDFKDQSSTLLAFIGSLASGLYTIFSIPTGSILSKVDHRTAMLVGAVLTGLGMIVASFATQVWLLFLGQSVIFAVGVSLCFIPAISIVPQWFDKHIGFGVGICAAGSGIGGLILSPIIRAISDQIGWRWALRINGIFAILVLSISAVTLKPRVPFNSPKIFDMEIVLDKKFIALWLHGAITCFAFWTPFFLMPIFCQYYSISTSSASLVIGLMNGAAALGRIITGLVGQKLGNINTLLVNNLICSLTFPLIWYFSTTTWSLILFALVFGYLTSALFTNSAILIPELFGLEKLAQVNGLFYTCLCPGFLVGTVISNAIIDASTVGDYTNFLPCMMYLFACYVGSCIFLVWLRLQVSRSLVAKV